MCDTDRCAHDRPDATLAAELSKWVLIMSSKPILWLLAIAFPIGLSVAIAAQLPSTAVARYLEGLVFTLALQPALRLHGISEANYWKFFAVVVAGSALLMPVRLPPTIGAAITTIILVAIAAAGVRTLVLRLRRTSSSS
ncbi:MAG TPA: hypothetical protein VGQ16_17135 [Vicinamibacterales bacterium]|jgi:hypothetical protein|nr:hypothetical protein [Vicinamibacterales bacterium]